MADENRDTADIEMHEEFEIDRLIPCLTGRQIQLYNFIENALDEYFIISVFIPFWILLIKSETVARFLRSEEHTSELQSPT